MFQRSRQRKTGLARRQAERCDAAFYHRWGARAICGKRRGSVQRRPRDNLPRVTASRRGFGRRWRPDRDCLLFAQNRAAHIGKGGRESTPTPPRQSRAASFARTLSPCGARAEASNRSIAAVPAAARRAAWLGVAAGRGVGPVGPRTECLSNRFQLPMTFLLALDRRVRGLFVSASVSLSGASCRRVSGRACVPTQRQGCVRR